MILLLDAKPGEFFKAPGTDRNFPGHNLGIQPDWPVRTESDWGKFKSALAGAYEEFCALMIHTGDSADPLGGGEKAPDKFAAWLSATGYNKPVVFFSGGGREEPAKYEAKLGWYGGEIWALDVDEARALLKEFGASRDCSVFEVTRLEVALQTLSALLLVGLTWDASRLADGEAGRASLAPNSTATSKFGQELHNYLWKSMTDAEAAASMRERLLQGGEYRAMRQWMKKLGGGDASGPLQQIDSYVGNLSSWKSDLESLRDDWLREAI